MAACDVIEEPNEELGPTSTVARVWIPTDEENKVIFQSMKSTKDGRDWM